MSRNEMFLLLACAFAAAIMAGGPVPLTRTPPVTIASLLTPLDDEASALGKAMVQHSFDHQ